MATAVINLLSAVFDYAPKRSGRAPTAGFLLAGFVFSMFISAGFLGSFGTDPVGRVRNSGSAGDRSFAIRRRRDGGISALRVAAPRVWLHRPRPT
jgi:hypothetical protein